MKEYGFMEWIYFIIHASMFRLPDQPSTPSEHHEKAHFEFDTPVSGIDMATSDLPSESESREYELSEAVAMIENLDGSAPIVLVQMQGGAGWVSAEPSVLDMPIEDGPEDNSARRLDTTRGFRIVSRENTMDGRELVTVEGYDTVGRPIRVVVEEKNLPLNRRSGPDAGDRAWAARRTAKDRL